MRVRGAAATLFAVLLLGCGQDEQAAREDLQAARQSASRSAQSVERESRQVVVDGVTLLRDRKTTAVAVELRNTADTILTDLPITIGVRRDGQELPYNATAGLAWHRTHVPAVPANGDTIWVFQAATDRRVPSGEVFARVGDPDGRLPAQDADALPNLATSWAPAGGNEREPRFFVGNQSDVPQRDVPVYAYVRTGERFVAAGVGTLPSLPAEETRSLAIRLAGDPGTGPFAAVVAPTVLR